MYAAGLALLSALGAWLAWRRNPLYSKASTLRFLAVAVLSIAALIAVIVATVNLTAKLSAPWVVVIMSAVAVVGALAMIFIIQAASTPKEARLITALPSGAKLVHVHRRKVYRWGKFFAILLAGCALLGMAVPGNARYVILSVGGIALMLAVILLPVMYFTARQFDRSLTALELNPWVHWAGDGAGAEAYFGHDGLYCNGVYTTWLSLSVYLTSAEIEDGPPRALLFTFEKVSTGPYAANQITPVQQRVLIPADAEADVARLQRELRVRCPKARISLGAAGR
jgi:hypothetical protein